LLANAVYQPKSMSQTHRHRGQARSYTGFCVGRNLEARHLHRLRRPIYQRMTRTRRSRLAGERVVSAEIYVTDPPRSRASALLHRFCVGRNLEARHRHRLRRPIYQRMTRTRRSRLAGERGVSAENHGTDPPPSRACALLHRVLRWPKSQGKTPTLVASADTSTHDTDP
jgi:hypothetical protein